tara:strand:+ start:6637 stop:7617 length:981 start_codon:yes stop_codon:yes gene_type:complete
MAFKLSKEGQDVHTLVWKKRYDTAWSGLLDKMHGPRTTKPEAWTEYLADPELVVLTDVPGVAHLFKESPCLFVAASTSTSAGDKVAPTLAPVSICAWFDGAQFSLPHWLLVDLGAWVGGQGPVVPGGGTIVYANDVPPQFFTVQDADQLAAEGAKGLVRFPTSFDQVSKEWKKGSPEVGWTGLHSHAFVYSLNSGDFSQLLLGHSISGLEKQYTVVVPVSIPPWPLHVKSAEANVYAETRNLDGTNAAVRQRLLLHDVKRTERGLSTAGLDGLIGVACGSGNTLSMAKLQALGTAGAIQVAEKQFRTDVGGKVEGFQVLLEGIDLV